MFEGLFALLCFGIFLAMLVAIVTVVGHGLWVMFAAFFGSKPATQRRENRDELLEARGVQCTACGLTFARRHHHCPRCGLEVNQRREEELDDLEASARIIQRFKEQGQLSAESCEQVYRAIEARQNELLARQTEWAIGPIAELEAWFGNDFGAALSVADKKRALARARTLEPGALRELSAAALVGLARLLTSVGMLSRACGVYQVLFDCHPQSHLRAKVAAEALDIACQLHDWQGGAEFARAVTAIPGLLEKHPELAALVERVREGDVAAPVVVPVAEVVTPPSVIVPVAESATVPKMASLSVTEIPALAPSAPLPEEEETFVATPLPEGEEKVVAATLQEGEGRVEPRRSFAEWIAVFMEEKNILWGELIGGTLIIGCSIALVISLWSTLAEIEFFPFLIFAAITSGVLGAGFYTLHHWKLESTSRGLLLIGMLLVPLNFAVPEGMAQDRDVGWLQYVFGAAALGLFSWMVFRAARILIQVPLDAPAPSAVLTTLGILVGAATLMLAPALLQPGRAAGFSEFGLSLLPVLVLSFSLGWILIRLASVDSWNAPRLGGLSVALGTATFACAVALGFPLFISGDTAATLLHLSPALTILGVPLLVAGTLMPRKIAASADAGPDGEPLALWRTVATGLALLGIFVSFGGFVAAMPEPTYRWLSGLINVTALFAVAWLLRAPYVHILAQLYAGVLVVTGAAVEFDVMQSSREAALRMTGFMMVQTLFAEVWLRLERRRDALCYGVGGGVTAALAALLILPLGQHEPGTVALVLGAIALTWLAANARWRLGQITYVCTLVLAAAIFFAVRRFAADIDFAEQLLWSLLTHASVCLVAALAFRAATADWLRDVFRTPLQISCLMGSAAVVGVIAVEQVRGALPWTATSSACLWLAGLWVTLAVLEGSAFLFAAFQTALFAAWIFGASGRLDDLQWQRWEPYSLQLIGFGLAALCAAWEIARYALRSRRRAMDLLESTFFPIDRMVSCGLIVSQYVLAVIVVLWSAGRELLANPDAWRVLPAEWYDNAFTFWPWLLLATLAGVMLGWMRRHFDAALVGFAMLLLTLPLLVTGGWFDAVISSASALRWGLAIVFGIGSILLWYRHHLKEHEGRIVPVLLLRATLLAGAVGPALFFTLIVVARKLTGGEFHGPIGGVFQAMGGPASLLVPLTFISATLAGHGFRERLAYYLTSAGLVASASAVGGFFLALPRADIGQTWVLVDALLLAAGTTWAWVLLWSWLATMLERSESRPLLDSPLLNVHVILGGTLFCAVLLPALLSIVSRGAETGREWTQAAGSVWGWITWGTMAGSLCHFFWSRRRSLPLHALGALSGIAFFVTACSVEVIEPGHSFRALMFVGGLFACVWMCANLFLDPAVPLAWLTSSRRRWEEVVYAAIGGSAAVLLGADSLLTNDDEVWSANSILLAAAACVLLAYRRKAELWGSLATLLTMLAGVIFVIHLDAANPHLGLRIIHVSLIILAAAALARLALHRFISADGLEVGQLIQFPVQIALGFLANLILLGSGLGELAVSPAHPDRWLPHLGDAFGWLALSANVAATMWYLVIVRPRLMVHALALCGLMIGISLAGSFTMLFPQTAWLGHHVLTLSWTVAALCLLVASWTSHVQVALGPQFWPTERRARLADFMRLCLPEPWARAWVTACGMFVVLLALRAIAVEPERPYWSVGNTVAVILLLGALAIWARAPSYLYGAGLLFNVVGLLIFTAWSAQRFNARGAVLPNDEWISIGVLAQILSFGAAAIVSSLLERNLLKRGIDFTRTIGVPYAQTALVCGIHLLAIGVGLANGLHLSGEEVRIAAGLAWIALAVLTVASLIELWRSAFHQFTRYHLYTCGLIAIGLTLHGLVLSVSRWYLDATLFLAGYVLLIATLTRALELLPQLAPRPDASGRWFWNVQLLSIVFVTGLALWITLTFGTTAERLCGALACGVATVAMIMLAPIWPRLYGIDESAIDRSSETWRRVPICLVHFLFIAIALDVSWAVIDPELNAIWLQRLAALLAVAVATTAVHQLLLPRWLHDSRWLEPNRTIRQIGGVVSLVLIVVLIASDLVAYNPDPEVRTTPLILPLTIVAGVAILAFTGLAFWSALARNSDVYGIEGQARSFYVYLTELLVVALIAHLRLNVPDILPRIFGQYWYLAIMVLAFVGTAVSEWFERKALPVLSVPLHRSAFLLAFVPILAFQLAHVAHVFKPLEAQLPGLSPFLKYLETLQQQKLLNVHILPMESLCWLLLAIFFGWQARLRQSANLGVFAALALNFGVWVLMSHQDATRFVERPQLWLIPLGLIILVAEFVNRRRLGFWPSLSVRYMGLLCIYLSSTLEMFMAGLGTSVIFPIALALLAIAGILLGILFKVRAFLLAGFMALFVDVFAQIWHAAVDRHQTWLWWASGIVLGVVILILFALFEKRRNDMLKMLDNMKRWN